MLRWRSPSRRIASVIFVSGFSSTWLWNQNTGRISIMPAIAMKNVSRPSAERVTVEREAGSDTVIMDTALPAMSRTA